MTSPLHRRVRALLLAGCPLVLILAAGAADPQVPQVVRAPVDIPARWLQGFARPIAGELLVYPWAYPGQARALLTHTTDGRMRIEWEAEPPPPGSGDEAVSYLWHAGFASGYGAHQFTLSLNGAAVATFTSGRDTNDREWTAAGTGGASVSFKTTRIGTFNELFGFMVLTVPRRMLGEGAPRLIINTAEATFAEFERRYGATLESRTGDMTPYWEDGAISTAAEEALVRAGVRRLVQTEALWALRDPAGFPAADADEAWRQALLWHEHTWGAAASISAPDSKGVVALWEYKRAFASEADRRATALLDAALPVPGPVLDIVNTLSFERGGLVVLPQALSQAGDRIEDEAGRTLPSQRLADGSLAVRVAGISAFGSIRLTVVAGAAVAPAVLVRIDGAVIDNGRLRVEVDRDTGAIRSLRWQPARGWDLAAGGPGFDRYLYVPGRDQGGDRAHRAGAVRDGAPAPGASHEVGTEGLGRAGRLWWVSDESVGSADNWPC